jgi:hypothetical protein
MNHCGTCEACCTWLTIEDPVLPKAAGVRCNNLGACGGCVIYADRPKACSDFRCIWLTAVYDGNAPPPEMRPDRSGVMFDAVGPRTLAARCDRARPHAWREEPAWSFVQRAARSGLTVIAGVTGSRRKFVVTADPFGRIAVRRDKFTEVDANGIQRMVK